MTLTLRGSIDSGNAAQTEKELFAALADAGGAERLVLDAEDLRYIASAGLRVILRLKKTCPALSIVNVSSDVYEILETTGFTEMMTVEKAYRRVSVEGCEVVGEGANGRVYRIGDDMVVKTYKNADALEEIRHERAVARLALILGVPTAISYDVVRVGDSYGSVFELLNARSFAKLLASEPERMDWCVGEYVKLLRKMHNTPVPPGKLRSIKAGALAWASRLRGYLPDAAAEKLDRLLRAVPDRGTLVHGDLHTKNVVLAGDEVLVIDMDTLSEGHPVFELAQMYNSYVGFGEYDPSVVSDFQGYGAETAAELWRRTLRAYLGTADAEAVRAVEDAVRVAAYAHLIDWSRRHKGEGSEADRASRALWTERLLALLETVDSLDFPVPPEAPEEEAERVLAIPAEVDRLQEVLDFIGEALDEAGCAPKAHMQIAIAAEEIFVNIASYAYAPGHGSAEIRLALTGAPKAVRITFTDRGVPFDPLARTDPDVTLAAEERGVGGLGIYMTKQFMDEVRYEYRDGQNVLTMTRKL